MTPGRRPTPTHLKVLTGNPGGRPLNRDEPKPPDRKPVCPSDLSPAAKKVWRATLRELRDMGLAYKSDEQLLTSFAIAVARRDQARHLIDTAGVLVRSRDGGLVKNPACQIERDSITTLTRLAAELGLSPSARSRLSIPGAEDHNDELARRYLS